MQTSARAVLWDMDGTLLDSAEYHWLAWREILAGERFELAHGQFVATFGQRNDTILRDWLGADLPLGEIARIGEAKEARYRALVQAGGITLLPGVERWLMRLQTDGWRQAVATAAPRANAEAIVAALGIAAYFDAISSAEDVQRGKPDPQVFLKAAERLGVDPSRAIVVEDAAAGIEGARRAAMKSIGVIKNGPLDADITVASLADLPPDAFDRLLDGARS